VFCEKLGVVVGGVAFLLRRSCPTPPPPRISCLACLLFFALFGGILPLIDLVFAFWYDAAIFEGEWEGLLKGKMKNESLIIRLAVLRDTLRKEGRDALAEIAVEALRFIEHQFATPPSGNPVRSSMRDKLTPRETTPEIPIPPGTITCR